MFKEGGSVTAGNSSGRNDGGACLVLMSTPRRPRPRGLKPLATVRGQATAAVDPRIMGIGPAPASRKALERSRAQPLATSASSRSTRPSRRRALAVVKELDLDQEIVNVNGGAIALGHPLGCSGARILTTLLYEMRRRGTRYGLASICIAGGQGMASVVEMAH